MNVSQTISLGKLKDIQLLVEAIQARGQPLFWDCPIEAGVGFARIIENIILGQRTVLPGDRLGAWVILNVPIEWWTRHIQIRGA